MINTNHAVDDVTFVFSIIKAINIKNVALLFHIYEIFLINFLSFDLSFFVLILERKI